MPNRPRRKLSKAVQLAKYQGLINGLRLAANRIERGCAGEMFEDPRPDAAVRQISAIDDGLGLAADLVGEVLGRRLAESGAPAAAAVQAAERFVTAVIVAHSRSTGPPRAGRRK